MPGYFVVIVHVFVYIARDHEDLALIPPAMQLIHYIVDVPSLEVLRPLGRMPKHALLREFIKGNGGNKLLKKFPTITLDMLNAVQRLFIAGTTFEV